MTTFNTTAWAPKALTALRIVAGLLFLAHGLIKLFGSPRALSQARCRC